MPPQKEGMKKDLLGELERLELKHFLAPSSIHNVLRRLRLELKPTDAILFFERADTEKTDAASFQLKIFTLLEEAGGTRLTRSRRYLPGNTNHQFRFLDLGGFSGIAMGCSSGTSRAGRGSV